MLLSKLIDNYIEDHETAWSVTTSKSERSRLKSIAHLIDLGPEHLYEELAKQGKKPYTIKTTFIRVGAFEAWAKAGTRYQDFMKKHANRFKHAYQKEELELTYDEAQRRIDTLPRDVQIMARGALATGVRLSEMYLAKDGRVTGKGGKTRKVYGRIEAVVPRSTFWNHLRRVGLKPHTLRKLCATRLAEAGATPADLCKVFGWSSIQTAYQYLQAKDDDRLESLMEKSQKGS